MTVWLLTYWQSIFKRYYSDKHSHVSEFLRTRWRQKSTGIDMEQNYVTVTLCVQLISNVWNTVFIWRQLNNCPEISDWLKAFAKQNKRKATCYGIWAEHNLTFVHGTWTDLGYDHVLSSENVHTARNSQHAVREFQFSSVQFVCGQQILAFNLS